MTVKFVKKISLRFSESSTYKFVFVFACVGNYQWLSGNIEVSLTEYGVFLGACISGILARDLKENYIGKKD